MSTVLWLVIPVFLIVPAWSQTTEAPETAKPACTQQTRGKLWPENTVRGAGVPIEICAPKGWHYRWQQLTIDVSKMKAAAKRKETVAVLPVAETHRD